MNFELVAGGERRKVAAALPPRRLVRRGSRPGVRVLPWLGVVVVAVLAGVLVARPANSLMEVAALCTTVQLFVCLRVVRSRGLWSVCGLVTIIWFVYFPLRLLKLSADRSDPTLYLAVQSAPDSLMVWVWILTTAGLAGFWAGVGLAGRISSRPRGVHEEQIAYPHFLILGFIGTMVRGFSAVAGLSSGFLTIASGLSLFGIAGASFCEVRGSTKHRYRSVILVIVDAALGFTSGFKEALLLPIAAWLIGRLTAGHRLRPRYVIVGVVSLVLAFGAVQGSRSNVARGHSGRDVIRSTIDGLSRYDLTTGQPRSYQGWQILGNAANGILFRLKGADYLIEVLDAVPSRIGFQGGRSLWQPAASVVPGSAFVVDLDNDYRQLSLGRFVTTKVIPESSADDPSSQSLTFPGDLYLNFGSAGIVVGMFALGGIFRLFDLYFSARDPKGAGILAMAGLPLVAVDRNIAYVLVTSATALLMLAAALQVFFSASLRRSG